MFRSLKTLAGILAMIVVMFLAGGITLRLALHAGEVRIPELTGLTVAEASDAALRGSLDLNIENRLYSTTVPAGRILSQAPAPGSKVRQGWQVRVVESLGPQQVTIPNVVGEPTHQATMDLRRDQLDLGTVIHMEAPGSSDFVLAQNPPPDAGIDQPRVNLLLSSTASDTAAGFQMPSFVGMSFAVANHAAIALGLRVATIGGIAAPAPVAAAGGPVGVDAMGQPVTAAPAPPVPTTPSGPVLSQVPEAGFRGHDGQTIRLYFSRSSASTAATEGSVASPPVATPVPTPATQP